MSPRLQRGTAVKANQARMAPEEFQKFQGQIRFVEKLYHDCWPCIFCDSEVGLDIVGAEQDPFWAWCTCAWIPIDDGDIQEIRNRHREFVPKELA